MIRAIMIEESPHLLHGLWRTLVEVVDRAAADRVERGRRLVGVALRVREAVS